MNDTPLNNNQEIKSDAGLDRLAPNDATPAIMRAVDQKVTDVKNDNTETVKVDRVLPFDPIINPIERR